LRAYHAVHAYHLISRPPISKISQLKGLPTSFNKNPALDCASVNTRFSKPPKLPKPLAQSPASRPVSLLCACWPARHLGKPRTARSASLWASLTSFRRYQIVSPLLNLTNRPASPYITAIQPIAIALSLQLRIGCSRASWELWASLSAFYHICPGLELEHSLPIPTHAEPTPVSLNFPIATGPFPFPNFVAHIRFSCQFVRSTRFSFVTCPGRTCYACASSTPPNSQLSSAICPK
jgi:hypothetical protein